MTTPNIPQSIVIMGVSGSGKSTVGNSLAQTINYNFIDADDLHPESNKQRMAAGIGLTDSERLPWLRIVGEELSSYEAIGRPVVVACSALKRSYRNLLREYSPNLYFIFLDGSKSEISERISARNHEFMPATLLDSQFSNLEPLESDEHGVRITIDASIDHIVRNITRLMAE